MREFFDNIDYGLLRKQKVELIDVIDNEYLAPHVKDSLTGILHLIDELQDTAFEYEFADEEIIYGNINEQ